MTMARKAEIERPNCPLYNDQKLKLGLFGTNCSNGLTVSHADTTYRATWEHSLAIARRADAMGFEMLVPIARWRGFGGTTSNGRFGLNLVMGWFTPEMEMFGAAQREHDERYTFGGEWIGIVKRLWTDEEAFHFDGKYFHIRGGQAHPKPLQKPYPVLVNAGNSPAGIEFSAREVDFNFMTIDKFEHSKELIDRMHQRAHSYGREIGIMTYAMLICRDTEREAQEVRREILEKGDWGAANNIMKVLGIESESFPHMQAFRERFILGWGGYPIVGTPEQAVDQLKTLSAMGIQGVILGFLDYHEELAYFDRAVMPLLRQVGLRR
jgi:dimethylsulfone monooxygenase